MHHHNCFVIESIAKELKKNIENTKLIDCFSNSINELYFEFEHFCMKILFHNGTLFFDFSQHLIGKNRLFKPQFTDVHLLKVLAVNHHQFERSFEIVFENQEILLFKCYSRQSNVIQFSVDGTTDVFRKNIEQDYQFKYSETQKFVDFKLNSLVLNDSINAAYPFLPKEFMEVYQNNQNLEQTELMFNSIKGYEINEEQIELVPNFENGNIFENITFFSHWALKTLTFKEQKSQLLLQKQKTLKEKTSYLSFNEKALLELNNLRNDEEIGHIILSNMHLFKANQKQQVLFDIYNQKEITIQIDTKLSAVENADKFFKKSKGKPFIIQQLQHKIQNTTIEVNHLKHQLEQLEKANSSKDLKSFVVQKKQKNIQEDLPYKYFKIQDYEILVGKHAESNEKLLNAFSDKNDFWLHAKDVSGSHVILRVKKGQIPTEPIIEKAASLAAYYSKNRNQNLVTVTYTLRKFVRKIKGAEKGKVTVSNEKTILVQPKKEA